MIHPNLFDEAQDLNSRVISINKTFAHDGISVDISVMPEFEDTVNNPECDSTSLEYLQAELRDKEGKIVEVLSTYLTNTEALCYLDGYEAAMEVSLRIMAAQTKFLTIDDMKMLLRIGYLVTDIPQIVDCAEKCKYFRNGKRLSYKRAQKILGREEWLSGIGRAAFHATATRGEAEPYSNLAS